MRTCVRVSLLVTYSLREQVIEMHSELQLYLLKTPSAHEWRGYVCHSRKRLPRKRLHLLCFLARLNASLA